jgi:plastocyanin domain-containing protein
MNKNLFIFVLFIVVVALGVAAGRNIDVQPPVKVETDSVTAEGQQILEITAKGGYSPSSQIAKAGVPATLKVKTQDSFDCSSVLVIPALHYRAHLPMTGTTDIPIPPQAPGTELTGTCGMGMYSFNIKFQ